MRLLIMQEYVSSIVVVASGGGCVCLLVIEEFLVEQVLHEALNRVFVHIEVVLSHILHLEVRDVLQVLQHQFLKTQWLLCLLSRVETHFLLQEEIKCKLFPLL
jgi:hypothetical protein